MRTRGYPSPRRDREQPCERLSRSCYDLLCIAEKKESRVQGKSSDSSTAMHSLNRTERIVHAATLARGVPETGNVLSCQRRDKHETRIHPEACSAFTHPREDSGDVTFTCRLPKDAICRTSPFSSSSSSTTTGQDFVLKHGPVHKPTKRLLISTTQLTNSKCPT